MTTNQPIKWNREAAGLYTGGDYKIERIARDYWVVYRRYEGEWACTEVGIETLGLAKDFVERLGF